MHEEVVRAVHRVHVAQQGQDLAVRALRRVEGVRLVPPQRRAAEAVAADGQLSDGGDEDDQPVSRAEPGPPPGCRSGGLAGAVR
ncbi:MAG: hypothetical protein ABSA03_05865 [Streptosporangiaceae bacterium]